MADCSKCQCCRLWLVALLAKHRVLCLCHTYQLFFLTVCMQEAMKTTAMLFVAVLLCMAGPGQAARDLLQGTCNPKVIRETQNSELRQTFQLTDGRGWFIELCAGPTVNVDSGRLQVIISNSMATTMKYGCGSSTYSYSLTMRDHYLFQDAK